MHGVFDYIMHKGRLPQNSSNSIFSCLQSTHFCNDISLSRRTNQRRTTMRYPTNNKSILHDCDSPWLPLPFSCLDRNCVLAAMSPLLPKPPYVTLFHEDLDVEAESENRQEARAAKGAGGAVVAAGFGAIISRKGRRKPPTCACHNGGRKTKGTRTGVDPAKRKGYRAHRGEGRIAFCSRVTHLSGCVATKYQRTISGCLTPREHSGESCTASRLVVDTSWCIQFALFLYGMLS